MGLSESILPTLSELDIHLGLSFPIGETVGPRGGGEGAGAMGTVLCQSGGGLIQSESSHFSYPSSVLPVSMFQRGASTSPLSAGIFTVQTSLSIVAH